jgi:hypothetical protein
MVSSVVTEKKQSLALSMRGVSFDLVVSYWDGEYSATLYKVFSAMSMTVREEVAVGNGKTEEEALEALENAPIFLADLIGDTTR